MPSPDLCTEEEIFQLVHDFYARVRVDAVLGPNQMVHRADPLAEIV